MSAAIAFTTPAEAPRWKRWLVYSPLARIVIFALLAVVLTFAGTFAASALGWNRLGYDSALKGCAELFSEALPWLLAYLLLVFLVERRRPAELAWSKLVPHSLAGLALGAAVFSTVIGVLGALGLYHVTGTRHDVHWLAAALVLGVVPGIGEEIVCRGVLFRIIEEGLGTWIALLVSALLFGLAHLGNPHATLWSALAIAIEAGLLFGLIYHVTRSLYLCMGLHAAWNMAEGTIYGVPVSGLPSRGWLTSTLSGPDWLSGGSFGPEASPVALACCALAALPFLVVMLHRHSMVPPSWRRRARVVETG
jgi:membrane protease YdiL (CAAX protease family)